MTWLYVLAVVPLLILISLLVFVLVMMSLLDVWRSAPWQIWALASLFVVVALGLWGLNGLLA